MTKPSDEAARRVQAKRAFKVLLAGGQHKRADLFDKNKKQGKSGRWQYEFLSRLMNMGVIVRIGEHTATCYELLDSDDAQKFASACLESEELLTELLWPGSLRLADPEVESYEESADDSDDIEYTPEQIQATLLQLMGAMVEKLDRIERASTETLKILKQLL